MALQVSGRCAIDHERNSNRSQEAEISSVHLGLYLKHFNNLIDVTAISRNLE